jgi:hypothetical protein
MIGSRVREALCTLPRMRTIAIACLLASCGCGNPAQYETWTLFESETNGYRLRLLAPPWRVGGEVRGVARFDVPPNQEADGGLIPSKYLLEIDVVRGAPASLAQAAERAARERGDEILAPVREITSASGDGGSELVTQRSDLRFLRSAFFVHPRGTLRLSLESNPNPDHREVDALFESVEIDP